MQIKIKKEAEPVVFKNLSLKKKEALLPLSKRHNAIKNTFVCFLLLKGILKNLTCVITPVPVFYPAVPV